MLQMRSVFTLERSLPALCVCGLAWFVFVDGQFTVLEIGRFLFGALVLWLPVGGMVYLSLRSSYENLLDRFTFSAIASHALTTLAYHFFSVLQLWIPGAERTFYIVQGLSVAILGGSVVSSWLKGDLKRGSFVHWRIDWILTSLIVMSLLVTARYKKPFEFLPGTADRHFVAEEDQLYFAAQAYELGRGVPARQQANRAGVRERAYHSYPHLTAMLLARYTAQPEMLRAELLYEYTVIEVLISLALFCMTRTITGSRMASYLAVALLYIFAVPLPPLDPSCARDPFYYTFYPHATSNLEPVLLTSPQMYAGLLIIYGVFLGVIQLSTNVVQGRPIAALAFATAGMVGTLIRFRVQTFLPLIPAFTIVLMAGWLQCRSRRRWIFIAAGAVACAISAGNLFEMKFDVYLPNSTASRLTNNLLSFRYPVFSSWPLAREIHGILRGWLSNTEFRWVWQVICIPIFSLVNVAGLPLIFASGVYFCSARARSANLLFTLLLIGLVLFSVLGGMFLVMGYDAYSVGGQMPFHVGWYLFPLQAIGLWLAARPAGRIWLHRQNPQILAAVLLVGACGWQRIRPPSGMEQLNRESQFTIAAEEWELLMHLRQELPATAVVLSVAPKLCLISGIGGKRAFMEYVPRGVVLDELIKRQDHCKARCGRIEAVWKSLEPAQFREQLIATGATHVCEGKENPFALSEPDCLRKVWVSSGGKWTLWERKSE